MEQENNDAAFDNESEIDKILDADIGAARAVRNIATPVATEPEKKEETAVEKTEVAPEKKEEQAAPAPSTEKKEEDDTQQAIAEGFKAPVKGKFESEESYDKRVELAGLVAARKGAKTEEDRQKLSGEIATARKDLAVINSKDETISNSHKDAATGTENKEEVDPVLAADQERLRKIGGATKDDINAVIEEREKAANVRNTLQDFVKRHPELQDEDAREVYFNFVDANYAWQNKTGKDLMTVLELARENMFKPSETINERVLKGADVAEKVNAMQFPGGTVVKQAIPEDKKASIAELMATGMTEEKALELISE